MSKLTEADIEELEELYNNSTPGPWKTWGTEARADQGGPDVESSIPVARFMGRRTYDLNLTCHMQRALPELLRVYRVAMGFQKPDAPPQLWVVLGENGVILDQDEDPERLGERAAALRARGWGAGLPQLKRRP